MHSSRASTPSASALSSHATRSASSDSKALRTTKSKAPRSNGLIMSTSRTPTSTVSSKSSCLPRATKAATFFFALTLPKNPLRTGSYTSRNASSRAAFCCMAPSKQKSPAACASLAHASASAASRNSAVSSDSCRCRWATASCRKARRVSAAVTWPWRNVRTAPAPSKVACVASAALCISASSTARPPRVRPTTRSWEACRLPFGVHRLPARTSRMKVQASGSGCVGHVPSSAAATVPCWVAQPSRAASGSLVMRLRFHGLWNSGSSEGTRSEGHERFRAPIHWPGHRCKAAAAAAAGESLSRAPNSSPRSRRLAVSQTISLTSPSRCAQ
mmetsp:Transcript_13047/g.38028  ORF Transcript_13047/g.38028 Transcript_13047/m.38028 type:complete len:330 (+) Transcript_13047:477-1466(+)